MAAVLYNCKRCKLGRRVEYPLQGDRRIDEVTGQAVHAGAWRVASLAKQPDAVRPGSFIVERGGWFHLYDGDPLAICGCGRLMTYGRLQARICPDVKCSAICTSARGFVCDCSCGGKNHGMGWGAAYREAA